MKKPTKLRVVSYMRAASADVRDQRQAITYQRQACRRQAERFDGEIASEYIDAAGLPGRAL